MTGGGPGGVQDVSGGLRGHQTARATPHCLRGCLYTPNRMNTWQKPRSATRVRHARTQTKCLQQARPDARLETSRSRLPTRIAAHHQKRGSSGGRTHRGWLTMPLLHEEARPVYLGHAEGELAVQHNINAQEAVRDHEQQAIVSRSCTQHSKAIGVGKGQPGRGPGRAGKRSCQSAYRSVDRSPPGLRATTTVQYSCSLPPQDAGELCSSNIEIDM